MFCCRFSFLTISLGEIYACNAGDPGSVPRLGRSHGEGNDYPFQYFYMEDSMDRGAWWATVCGVAERYNEHTHTHHKRIKK